MQIALGSSCSLRAGSSGLRADVLWGDGERVNFKYVLGDGGGVERLCSQPVVCS